MGYFLLLPMRPKISKFSSETQKLPEIGCVRFRIRFKNNCHTLNNTFFFYIKISSSFIFSMIWWDPPAGGNCRTFVCVLFRKWSWVPPPPQKNSCLNPWSFWIPWLGSLREVCPPKKTIVFIFCSGKIRSNFSGQKNDTPCVGLKVKTMDVFQCIASKLNDISGARQLLTTSCESICCS